MPNYKISLAVREHISKNAMHLAMRPLMNALTNFPLTTAEVQYHCVALNDEQVGTLQRLKTEGVETIERHRQIRLALVRDTIPELRRGVVLAVHLPEPIFVGRATQYGIPATKFRPDENHYIVPDLANLDATSRRALVVWVERALRQVRLFEITDYCVKKVLEDHAPTASHLHAIWPTLTTLVNLANAGPHVSHRRRFGRTTPDVSTSWQEKFRNPTRSLKQYQPDSDVRNKFAKLITASDTMIVAGQFLRDMPYRRDVINVNIEHWERLEGDLTFPLA